MIVRVNKRLFDEVKVEAKKYNLTISSQIEFWAILGRSALDNPDLPITFISESLLMLSESERVLTKFVPRKIKEK